MAIFVNSASILSSLLLLCLLASAASAASSNRVCKTAGCIEAALQVGRNMDTSIDPCDNFYKFACGRFIQNSLIPDDKPGVSIFAEKSTELQEQLKRSLQMRMDDGQPKTFKTLQSLYNSCLDTEKADKIGNEQVKAILARLGGWPVVSGEAWNETSFDWQQLTYELRRVGYATSINSLLTLRIEADMKNTSRNILNFDQASTGVEQAYLSKGLQDRVVQAYYKYMLHLAEILGADRQQAHQQLAESLNFEVELAKISLTSEQRRNKSQLYNLLSVEQLEWKYPYAAGWLQYFNKILWPKSYVELGDDINLLVPSFLSKLPRLLSKTPKRVLANYMIWRVVEESAPFMNEQARKAKVAYSASLTGVSLEPPRWTQCLQYLSDYLPQAMGALYVRTSFDKESKAQVERLAKDLRRSFDRMLAEIDWMDEETKKAARIKLNAIQQHIAYPHQFLDDNQLHQHFGHLNIDSAFSFLNSHLTLNLFNFDYQADRLRRPVDKQDWLSHGKSAVVNAFYSFSENTIEIPAGILQGEFFGKTRPSYMNYAAIGWVIGHEFTHGFDDEGSQYDRDGNLADWWQLSTKKEYLRRAQCIVEQYSNYTVTQVGLNINGKNTQGENIADNGGMKEAYLAYQQFEADNGQEPRLPGLSYSPRQMFWISAANLWCNKLRPERLEHLVVVDVHSPGEFRVNGVLSNMPQFANDFQCPVGSPMNPVNKCAVW